jgi:putative sterol carrier protein
MPALTSLLQLAELPAAEVDRFFAEGDPEHIVALVDAATDEELRRLVGRADVRDAAVHHVLHRLGEFALPDRLRQVHGVVEFVVEVPQGPPERHALVFDGHTVAVLEGDTPEPDVTIETGILDFVRLVSGGVNAALLLLGGRLRVVGDEPLALAVGGVFQVPGKPGVAVDPAEVDPEQVARVLGQARDGHLEQVMTGGFRAVVLEQVFARFPEFLDRRKAGKHTLHVGFTITGRPDGGADRNVVHDVDGTCRVEAGDVDSRDATVTLSGQDFLRLVTGHLNPVMGVMRGAVKVRGDVSRALLLHKIMRIPGQR